jgi:2-polyprenyl-3-methyl-5-hydroxy-6-metoxy-1,4-benzoquinol methylase
MMTSFPENIPVILNVAASLKPKKILDVGPGFGKFGLMLREALLSIRAEDKSEAIPKQDFEIHCVESCRYFIGQPWHTSLYENHFHGDLFNIKMDTLAAQHYDLMLLIDVIEHGPKEKWLKWISEFRVASRKTQLLISTPKKVCFYKVHFYGSDCPLHQAQWCWDDFKVFPHQVIDTKNSMIVLIQ